MGLKGITVIVKRICN